MRDRRLIEEESYSNITSYDSKIDQLTLEILLDIRDQLTSLISSKQMGSLEDNSWAKKGKRK